jgi:hypothetical protein
MCTTLRTGPASNGYSSPANPDLLPDSIPKMVLVTCELDAARRRRVVPGNVGGS